MMRKKSWKKAQKSNGSHRKKRQPQNELSPNEPFASMKKSQSSSDEDVDICLICMQNLKADWARTAPSSVTSAKCHLKCTNMTRSYFTCRNCDSDADFSFEAEQYIFLYCSILFFMAKAFVISKPTINTWNLAFTLHFFQPILNFVCCLNLRDKYFGNQKSCVRKFAHNFFFAKHCKCFFS